MVISIMLGLFVALLTGAILVRYDHLHSHVTFDHTDGPQKFHSHQAIRLGGVPIIVGLIAGLCYQGFRHEPWGYLKFIAVCSPIFFIGLAEDLTRKIQPFPRLIAAFVSALFGVILLSATLNRIDFAPVDALLLASPAMAGILTMILIGGVTHAFNIIDGYNGLSGMVTVIILVGLGYVSFKVNDFFITGICAALIGAILGFLFWNFPRGHIFAGDSGAYLMGFAVAELSVLLVCRNPSVSPWFPLLLVIYPVFETLFSMYRRKFLQGRSITYPDALHLHSMIYRRLVRGMIGTAYNSKPINKNAMTSPYLWAMTLTTFIPGVLLWNNTAVLIGCTLAFTGTYVWLYRRIVHFKTPKFFILRLKTK